MHYLYGSNPDVAAKLVATFDSEAQTFAYISWATLKRFPDGAAKHEQGSALANFQRWSHSTTPLTTDDPDNVVHNPSPSML